MKKLMLVFAMLLVGLNFCSCTKEHVAEIEILATEGEQETTETDPDEGQ